MTRRAATLLALVCALSLGAPMVAAAASRGTPSQAISDCNQHGRLTAAYSTSTLRAALAQMPVDVKEYTDCYDVIENRHSTVDELEQLVPSDVADHRDRGARAGRDHVRRDGGAPALGRRPRGTGRAARRRWRTSRRARYLIAKAPPTNLRRRRQVSLTLCVRL